MTSDTAAIEVQARSGWADWVGMTASIGCAIHCAAMPLVLAYLPTFGLGWLASEGFHKWMALVCFGLAAAAFVPGWRKHGSFVPAVWGGVGLLLLTTAAFALEDSCCAACAPGDDQVTTAGTESVPITDECTSRESCQPETTSPTTVSVASVTPFVTPLGGLFLVVGHVVNHRRTCLCQGDSCCQ